VPRDGIEPPTRGFSVLVYFAVIVVKRAKFTYHVCTDCTPPHRPASASPPPNAESPSPPAWGAWGSTSAEESSPTVYVFTPPATPEGDGLKIDRK
jgi:hypothetical protein